MKSREQRKTEKNNNSLRHLFYDPNGCVFFLVRDSQISELKSIAIATGAGNKLRLFLTKNEVEIAKDGREVRIKLPIEVRGTLARGKVLRRGTLLKIHLTFRLKPALNSREGRLNCLGPASPWRGRGAIG
jgi:hypothetical protein